MKHEEYHHSGDCALHKAIEADNKERVLELLDKGANIDAVCWIGSYNWTPLMLAADYGNVNIATLLLERGASIDFRNLHGGTVLMAAVRDGHTNVAKVLVQAGADINACGGGERMATTLMAAIVTNSLAGIQFLLDYGVDINARDANGETALTWAEKVEDMFGPEAVALLKQAGAAH